MPRIKRIEVLLLKGRPDDRVKYVGGGFGVEFLLLLGCHALRVAARGSRPQRLHGFPAVHHPLQRITDGRLLAVFPGVVLPLHHPDANVLPNRHGAGHGSPSANDTTSYTTCILCAESSMSSRS